MGSGEVVGALGDLFASVINQNGTAWRSGPATTVISAPSSWLAQASAATDSAESYQRWIACELDGSGHGA
jgi:hypothetical protein